MFGFKTRRLGYRAMARGNEDMRALRCPRFPRISDMVLRGRSGYDTSRNMLSCICLVVKQSVEFYVIIKCDAIQSVNHVN